MSMTKDEQMWNDEREVREGHLVNPDVDCRHHDIVPPWIEQDIQYDQVMAIVEGGCNSGAYMPSVTYHIASDVMGEHGDAVLEYLDNYDLTDEVPLYQTGDSWSMIAVRALSLAVELWASRIYDAYEAQTDTMEDKLDRLSKRTWSAQGVTE